MLILDYDGIPFSEVFKLINRSKIDLVWVAQPTQNGWHVYTNYWHAFPVILKIAERMKADPAWLRIGKKRGYLFLADKAPVPLPWPVERMVIARGQAGRNI